MKVLLDKKKYLFLILIILLFYFVIISILWKNLPSKIYIPFHWTGYREVGFYDKNISNVKFVFFIPIIASILIQIANVIAFKKTIDLFSVIVSKSLDLLCLLLVSLEPLAFIVCSYYQTSKLMYLFYFISFLILMINIINIKKRYLNGLE